MYDLSFFRANLDAIAARLAGRGFVLNVEEFRDLDRRRRAAVTEAEQLKAWRNAESAEIQKLRKQGADTAERQQAARAAAERISALDEQVKGLDEEFRQALAGVPNLPHESVPSGPDRRRQRRSAARGASRRQFDFPAQGALGPRAGAGHSGPGAGGQGHRRAVRGLLGPGREARARAHQLHARRAYARARLHGGAAALPGQLGQPVRHGPVAEVRRGPVQGARTPISGWRPRPRCRSPTCSATRRWTRTGCPSSCAPTRRASAARPAPTGATCAASSASTSSRKWSW